MIHNNTPKEYKKRINSVVNYIVNNPKEDLSLSHLSGIGNYSPFHLQRIFKKVMGENPKHFIKRIRLVECAYYLITHDHRSITELALESGFASPATFARAFKNYFGVTADELRNLSPVEQVKVISIASQEAPIIDETLKRKFDAFFDKKINVVVKNKSSFCITYNNSPIFSTRTIQENFNKIVLFADTHDLLTTDTKFIGIMNPHAGIYSAAITYHSYRTPPRDTHIKEIAGGKFAAYKIKGGSTETIHSLISFLDQSANRSPYRIKQPFAFEILSHNPLKKPYKDIDREIHIPIEPA